MATVLGISTLFTSLFLSEVIVDSKPVTTNRSTAGVPLKLPHALLNLVDRTGVAMVSQRIAGALALLRVRIKETQMPSPAQLVGNLSGAVGSDFRRSPNPPLA